MPTSPFSFSDRGVHSSLHQMRIQMCFTTDRSALIKTLFILKIPWFFPSTSSYASKPDLIATKEVFC